MATTALRAQCHCKQASFTFAVPSTSFPLSSGLCSCSSCRFATGQLAASFATIPPGPDTQKPEVTNLLSYASSNHRERYFCPTCGTNVLDLDRLDGMWHVCTGALDRTEGLLERNLIFIDDTRDGGLSIWMKGVGKKFIGGRSQETMEGEPGLRQRTDLGTLPPVARLHGSCHCHGVQFDILRPSDEKRYEAGLCACTSCRTTSGFEITAWTSIPLSQVQMPNSKPLNLSAGTLKQYTSSPGVARHFCGRCGATVFCSKEDQSWIDVAVGLLRAEEGARAERWLEWLSEVGFSEEATDQQMVNRLGAGLKDWASEKNST